MLDRYEHNWLAHVGLSPTFSNAGTKLRTFIQVKREFGLEKYIMVEKNFKRRQHMSKLRISAHPLRIESGRYCRPPLPPEQRVCQYCNIDAVENEEHFILECTLYNDERHELLQSLGHIFPDFVNFTKMETFNFILSLNNGDTELVEPVLKFVSACFEKRSPSVA